MKIEDGKKKKRRKESEGLKRVEDEKGGVGREIGNRNRNRKYDYYIILYLGDLGVVGATVCIFCTSIYSLLFF